MKTAILVDGGFYRKRAKFLWGEKTPENRASELMAYCSAHLKYEQKFGDRSLYRIFYYDCPPIDKTVYHPLLQRGIDLRHSETHKWTIAFYDQLKKQRKVALRMGKLSDDFATYSISPEALKSLCSNKKKISDLSEKDFHITNIHRMISFPLSSRKNNQERKSSFWHRLANCRMACRT